MIKHCIFDLDGTLLNTLPTIRYYLNKALKKNGFSEISLDECRSFIGDGAYNLLKRALGVSGVSDESIIQRILAEYIDLYNTDSTYLTEPYEGIRELLAELSSHGIKLSVLSNKQNSTTVDTVRRFFGDIFDTVRGGLSGVKLKPDAAPALLVAESVGTSADECAFIGDTPVDIMTGKNMNAGLSVGVLWGYRDKDTLICAGAELLASTPEELKEILLSASEGTR